MINSLVRSLRRALPLAAVAGALACLASPPAQARVFVGIGVPFPGFYYPPPVYYPPPPPVYYPPPPIVYAPPPPVSYAPPAPNPQMCYAGQYTCPMDRPTSTGASCYCLGNGGQRVWGRAS